MNKETQQRFFDAFPVLYSGRSLPVTESLMRFGLEVRDGWETLLWDLSEKLEAHITVTYPEDPPIASQVKEKFGALRFYMSRRDDDWINNTIHEAESLSLHTCEITGTSGSIRNIRGWLKCLSDAEYLKECERRGITPK